MSKLAVKSWREPLFCRELWKQRGGIALDIEKLQNNDFSKEKLEALKEILSAKKDKLHNIERNLLEKRARIGKQEAEYAFYEQLELNEIRTYSGKVQRARVDKENLKREYLNFLRKKKEVIEQLETEIEHIEVLIRQLEVNIL